MVVFDGAAAGCAVSTSITRGCMVVLLAVYMRFSSDHSETFYALKTGFFQYLHKHKTELLVFREKLNNNERIHHDNNDTSHSRSPDDAMSNTSHGNGVEMTDTGNSSHHSDNEEEVEEHADTDTLLSTHHTATGSSHNRFPSLFETKRKTLLFLSLGIPGGLVLIVELWTFDIATIIVSQIGKQALSKH